MSSLRGGSGLRHKRSKDNSSPLEGMVNIIDAMLVLACSLMLSVFLNGNTSSGLVDVNVDLGKEVNNLESVQKNLDQMMNKDDKYQKMGMLYKDPVTGKMYMISETP
ncbi:hypothetical protein [Paenibacillus apii]|uniref:hypothetical protein n=1 Tax=Paenibacillus apii TaxID=1850370 RepID=UPI00143A7EA0|nr:hypothetical protein [Paenibacillus apii]NJJ41330.1 hypothetical protein [Paenibacillus apii]